MKNSFIINNNTITFNNLITNLYDTTTELISDLSSITHYLNKLEIENYIVNTTNNITVNCNPTHFDSINNDINNFDSNLYTNINTKILSLYPNVDYTPINIPNTISDNTNSIAKLNIEYTQGCSIYQDVTNLKKYLYTTFKNVEPPITSSFIYPISNGGDIKLILDRNLSITPDADEYNLMTTTSYSGEYLYVKGLLKGYGYLTDTWVKMKDPDINTFNLYCEFYEPKIINKFSLCMKGGYFKEYIKTLILTNPNNLNELCNFNNLISMEDELLLPQMDVTISGLNEEINQFEILFNGEYTRQYLKQPAGYSLTSYCRSRDCYAPNLRVYPKIEYKNILFDNSKAYKKYKMTVNTKRVNILSYLNLDCDPNIINKSTNIPNDITYPETIIPDIKDIAYNYIDSNSSQITPSTVFSNITGSINNDNLTLSFYVNTLYKYSYMYGNLISSITAKLVTYDLYNFKELYDSTILEIVTFDITDILEPCNITFNNLTYTEIQALDNYNIEFTINYNLNKYDELFKINKIETLDVNEMFYNYDYNFKLNNTSSYSNELPKELITYTSTDSTLSDYTTTITKSNKSMINIPISVTDIKITMSNDYYGYISPYYNSKEIHLGGNINFNINSLFTLYGLLEVSQCDGTQILNTSYLDKNNNIVLPVNDLLNFTNGFTLTYNRYNNNNAYSENSVNINLNNIIILPTTKYLIIKLLLKPFNTSDKYYPNDFNIYRTITFKYDLKLDENTHECNNISEIESIINDKYISFYKINRGVKI